jgi:hypothetical protein
MGLYDDTDPFESGFEAGRRHGAREARADERERCRAELREKVEEFEGQAWWQFDDHEIWHAFREWTREEAFGGE